GEFQIPVRWNSRLVARADPDQETPIRIRRVGFRYEELEFLSGNLIIACRNRDSKSALDFCRGYIRRRLAELNIVPAQGNPVRVRSAGIHRGCIQGTSEQKLW